MYRPDSMFSKSDNIARTPLHLIELHVKMMMMMMMMMMMIEWCFVHSR